MLNLKLETKFLFMISLVNLTVDDQGNTAVVTAEWYSL